jgi:hypothetical protein
MESLQLSQVLADLGNLGAAEPQTANAIVTANRAVASVAHQDALHRSASATPSPSASTNSLRPPNQSRPSVLKRALSSDEPKVDKFGRKILSGPPTPMQSSINLIKSTPGTPRRHESDLDDDLERASTLMALYDIRSKLKQQDNSSLMKAREKINALAARQQAQAAAEKNVKTAEEIRRSRYSFPKPGL